MYLSLEYKRSNIIRGGLIYCTGDTIAALLLNEFSITRLLMMVAVGATLYALEIPNYFKWIDSKAATYKGVRKSMVKTLLALLYFNPLWIARHLFFIKISMMPWQQISFYVLINIAFYSFLVNIPISFIANYLIQNKINLRWRFMASAIFSALMAIYYAMSTVWFN
ncbi:hypothetical protein GCM10009122_19800 [Fulvivirga kasyanovii]|uniref:LysE family translocator n=1 Tax=Fulvivirga kasyanovii TaxID=396812 RepID=A0ABW9RRZ1_9BACT|nr:hypothetical protein [Fulvivirga kasyanovii]MTI26471.1 hypothetical protein [Fulvivirga kasyanovii]